MTIIEAIKQVLAPINNGLTSDQIYNLIIEKKLYIFGAKNPRGVVNGEIRRHCSGLNFPTASLVKHFKIAGHTGKKLRFALIDAIGQNDVASETFHNDKDFLPEEKIIEAYKEHLNGIKQRLLLFISDNHPDFFEKLVVDLLLQLGYGYDKQAGKVVGGPGDGGIDGVISQDKLGLDVIYIQAKRYNAGNKVGRKELQAFIGAMQHIQKGVFITTSTFTNEALTFGETQQQKNIKLIDGDLLTSLMVSHGVGVESVQSFDVYKIDRSYFEE